MNLKLEIGVHCGTISPMVTMLRTAGNTLGRIF